MAEDSRRHSYELIDTETGELVEVTLYGYEMKGLKGLLRETIRVRRCRATVWHGGGFEIDLEVLAAEVSEEREMQLLFGGGEAAPEEE